jgi:hypothetical protein
MAADKQSQQGFKYEKNVASFLKKKGLVDSRFNPAGATSKSADLEMLWKKKKINVELKITAASGGSLVLKWTNGKWHFDDVSGNPEKQFLADLAKSSGALAKVNKKWVGIPAKHANINSTKKEEKMLAMRLKNAKSRAEKDAIIASEQQKFSEINEELDGSVISEYYAMKDTYYVNIGTNGFYRFGKSDPAGVNENCSKKGIPLVPSFGEAANVKYRARVQAKGGGNFQYTFELSFSVPKSKNSPYNIGPCSGENSVAIVDRNVNINCFL